MIYFIIAYILNVYLNRLLYFQLIKIDEDFYPNPPAFITIFLSLMGTIILCILCYNEWDDKSKLISISNWFKPKFLDNDE